MSHRSGSQDDRMRSLEHNIGQRSQHGQILGVVGCLAVALVGRFVLVDFVQNKVLTLVLGVHFGQLVLEAARLLVGLSNERLENLLHLIDLVRLGSEVNIEDHVRCIRDFVSCHCLSTATTGASEGGDVVVCDVFDIRSANQIKPRCDASDACHDCSMDSVLNVEQCFVS